MLKFVKYLKLFKKEVIIGPVFKLIEAIFELLVPLVMAKIIDVGIKNGDTAYVLKMGGVMVLLGVIGLCCALICQYLAARASQGFGTVVRNELFSHMNSLSYAEIDQIGTPSLITRITNDVNQLQLAVAMLIRLVIRAPFLVIGATVMAMLLDLQLSVVFLVSAPLIAVVLYFIMSRSVPYYRAIQKKLDRISLITRENLTGVRVIRAFSKQKKEKQRFADASNDQMKTSLSVGKLSALLNPLTSVIINLSIIAVVWFGGVRVYAGELEQGEVIAFISYLSQILLSLIVLANLVVIFTKASASATRVNEIFETKSTVSDTGNREITAPKDTSVPKIEFDRVSLSYTRTEECSLNRLSAKIYAGETVGIIGGTGSGKTTLINLIPRFYEATQGNVLVDGVNVKQYPFRQLRQKIGLVPQSAMLFTGTIRKNMQWSCENAEDAQIAKALRIAQADEFVNTLPDGYDSMVQQAGKNFSGGQRQRLTIARALVGNPEILILDDSSSALDFATDAALRKSITQEMGAATVLIVSQRANSIMHADKIIVLEDGNVAGIGTHQELFAHCAVYQEICLSQMNAQEASGQPQAKGEHTR